MDVHPDGRQGELYSWSVWLETDVSREELLGQTTNNLDAQLGQPG